MGRFGFYSKWLISMAGNWRALWDDLKFDLRHCADIERLAMVGDARWEQGVSQFCRPFTTATIRYFDHSMIAEARNWIEAD